MMAGKHFLLFHDGELWAVCDLETGARLRTAKVRSLVPVGTANGATFRDKIPDAPTAALRITGTVVRRGDDVIFTPPTNGQAKSPRKMKVQIGRTERPPCVHLGAQVSTIGCESCTGTTELPVFSCAIHEECVTGSPQEDLKGCRRCKDYRAPAPA